MALNRHLLKRARDCSRGTTIAQCPACAEAGMDQEGNHLVVFPDGRFACVCHPGPAGKEHRQRIWQLAGDRHAPRWPGAIDYVVRRKADGYWLMAKANDE